MKNIIAAINLFDNLNNNNKTLFKYYASSSLSKPNKTLINETINSLPPILQNISTLIASYVSYPISKQASLNNHSINDYIYFLENLHPFIQENYNPVICNISSLNLNTLKLYKTYSQSHNDNIARLILNNMQNLHSMISKLS
jgi:hypothetical protein